MTVLVIGTVRVARENIEAARGEMEAMVLGSRAEPGCLAYAYSEDLLEPGLIRVTEVWKDREALRLHFQTPHMAAWRAAWPAIGVSDRQLQLFEAGEAETL